MDPRPVNTAISHDSRPLSVDLPRPHGDAAGFTLPPYFLMGLISGWGVHTHQLWGAIPLVLLISIAHYSPLRFPVTDREFHRLADLTGLLWLGAISYLLMNPGSGGLQTLLLWSPLLMAPLLLVQIYSVAGTIKLSSLFWSIRRAEKLGAFESSRVDLQPSFAVLCLLAASPAPDYEFYVTFIAIATVWFLSVNRPKRYPQWIGLLLLLGVVGIAWGVQSGLRYAQGEVENWMMTWMEGWLEELRLGQNSRLGDVRGMKGREEIVLRVSPTTPLREPLLLPTAIFERYLRQEWWTVQRYESIRPENDLLLRWPLTDDPTLVPTETFTVSMNLRRGRGLLARPPQTVAFDDLAVGHLERNQLDTLRVSDGPGLIHYRVELSPEQFLASPPTEDDFLLPPTEAAWLTEWVQAQELTALPPRERVHAIEAHFASFRYTLNPPRDLATFFFEQQAGHCEYFATVTALLLRAAGLPTRYVTGYAVSEFSQWERAYVARRRHGHAWVMVFVDDQWRFIDTTPSLWLAEEELGAPWWQALQDALSYGMYQLDRWRWRLEEETSTGNGIGMLGIAILGGILVWRIRRRKRVVVNRSTLPQWGPIQGGDAPFYAVLARLEKQHGPRPRGQAVGRWLEALPRDDLASLQAQYRQHCRWRFGPR